MLKPFIHSEVFAQNHLDYTETNGTCKLSKTQRKSCQKTLLEGDSLKFTLKKFKQYPMGRKCEQKWRVS